MGRSRFVFGLCLALGVMYPMARVVLNFSRDSGFQREMVELAEHVLGPHETYLAGVDLLYGRKQPVGTLRWLDRPRRDLVQQLSANRLAALIEHSRTLTPEGCDRQLSAAAATGTASRLPNFRDHSALGNLRIYGPSVGSGDRMVTLKFTGGYGVEVPPGVPWIDSGAVAPGAVVMLREGNTSNRK